MNMKVLALIQVAHSKNMLLLEYFRIFLKMFFCAGYSEDLPFCFTHAAGQFHACSMSTWPLVIIRHLCVDVRVHVL